MPDPELASTLPIADSFDEEYLLHYQFLPLRIEDGRLVVAASGEQDANVLQDLEYTFQVPVALVPAILEDLLPGIRRAFAVKDSVVELVKDLDGDLPVGDLRGAETTDVRSLANQPFVVRFVNSLIREAYEAAASDIHVEATKGGLRVRLRVDGFLSEMPTPPPAHQAAIVSRLKLIADLDIAERRLPQDGRVRVRLADRELDIRVATAPTLHGESVVLRLLDRGGQPVRLDGLGMATEQLAGFERLCRGNHGILLSTGPTGSGKTTTLYAALGVRNPTEEKIITVEEPVEYQLPEVTQVPVHVKAGVTFATALRSILRQDPDVLMVGEMRDAETAAIAVQAAMTGHLVFSTLHTTDAVSALTRMTDLGVEPYMVAATVEGILAQRLVRRVCPECRAGYRPDPQMVAFVSGGPVAVDAGALTFQRGLGCQRCRGTGYSGRIGLYELLVMSEELSRALLANHELAELRRIALGQGMTTLRENGWVKVRAGITTIEEVARVCGE